VIFGREVLLQEVNPILLDAVSRGSNGIISARAGFQIRNVVDGVVDGRQAGHGRQCIAAASEGSDTIDRHGALVDGGAKLLRWANHAVDAAFITVGSVAAVVEIADLHRELLLGRDGE